MRAIQSVTRGLTLLLSSQIFSISLILMSLLIAIRVHPMDGSDFRWYWTLAQCVKDGVDPYIPTVRNYYTQFHPKTFDIAHMGYPPTTGVLLLPFGLLKFSIAAWIYKALSFAILVSGLIKVVSDKKSKYSLGIIGLIFLWSPVRWNSTNLQVTLLIAGLYCWFIYFVKEKKAIPAGILALLAMMLKVSDSLPFIILLFIAFPFRTLVATVASFFGILVLSFARVGGWSAFQNWLQDLREFSRADDPTNAISPYTRYSGVRIDIGYFLNGLHDQFKYASVIAIATVVLLLAYAVYKGIFKQEITTDLLIFTTTVGLIPTYHHLYAWVYFAPIIALAFTSKQARKITFNRVPLIMLVIYGYTTTMDQHVKILEMYTNQFCVVAFKTYPSLLALIMVFTSLYYLVSRKKQQQNTVFCPKQTPICVGE